jgi:hypothetical protein
MSDKISQKQLDDLIRDAAYLKDEAEALQYVIDEVPYAENPPGRQSIAEMLLLIDHAQLSYFRPILNDAIENPHPTHIENFNHFEETFTTEPKKINDIENLLNKLAKHRAGIINDIRNVAIIDWSTIIYGGDQEMLLFDFIYKMIHFDRKQLKKISELVRAFSDQKQSNREIEQKRAARKLN